MSGSWQADPHNLRRFVEAQEPVIDRVLAELRRGRKESHWMWFVFPQIAGLGRSDTARHFALASLGEAQAYCEHPVLGPRLRACTELVLQSHARSADDIFGAIDSLKLRSCMTLFAEAAPDPSIFTATLRRYFEGEPDSLTVERLSRLVGERTGRQQENR